MSLALSRTMTIIARYTLLYESTVYIHLLYGVLSCIYQLSIYTSCTVCSPVCISCLYTPAVRCALLYLSAVYIHQLYGVLSCMHQLSIYTSCTVCSPVCISCLYTPGVRCALDSTVAVIADAKSVSLTKAVGFHSNIFGRSQLRTSRIRGRIRGRIRSC